MRSTEKQVWIPAGSASLKGRLSLPSGASGLIIADQTVNRVRPTLQLLGASDFARLDITLLTPEEQTHDLWTRKLRFDVDFLSGRLIAVLGWLTSQKATRHLRIGLLSTQFGAAVAMIAAAQCPKEVTTLASFSGKLDMAFEVLPTIRIPTLLIVGGKDPLGLMSTKKAFNQLNVPKKLEIIPTASELLEEPGALEMAARLIREWFQFHFLSLAVGGG